MCGFGCVGSSVRVAGSMSNNSYLDERRVGEALVGLHDGRAKGKPPRLSLSKDII